jgi:hypothetical protein
MLTPVCPDTGTYAENSVFMKELYEQESTVCKKVFSNSCMKKSSAV